MEKYPQLKNDLLVRAALGQTVPRPPVWVMRQAGRYLPEYHKAKGDHDFFDVCRTPSLACEITLQPVLRYEGLLDAAIIFSDILVIPQAMGMPVRMLPKSGPNFPQPLREPSDISSLDTSPDIVKSKLSYVLDAISLTRKTLDGRVPLIGFCGGPWTLLSYMIEGGGSKTFMLSKTWLFKYPMQSKELLRSLANICSEFLAQQILAGAQVVQVFESHAGELSSNDFSEFCLPYLKSISQQVPLLLSRYGITEKVPMIIFAKGAWYAIEALSNSGYDAVGLDWTVQPEAAVQLTGGRVTLQGNLDPNVLYGGKSAITKYTESMIRGFASGNGRYIINLGHGITPFVNPDDLRWFLEECHRLGTEFWGNANGHGSLAAGYS